MKKSQLRNIIKESIKELMTEQSVQYTMSNIQDAITAAPVDFTYAVCQAEAQAANYWTSTNTGCFTMTIPNASAQQLQDPMNNPGNYSLVDAANDPNSGFYDMTPGGGTSPCVAACAAYNSGPCANSTNPNCNATCYTCIDGEIIEQIPGFTWPDATSNPSLCGTANNGALPNPYSSYNFNVGNTTMITTSTGPIMPPVIWWTPDINHPVFVQYGCSVSGTGTTPVVLNPGCTVVQSPNYDATADGCEVNGVVDPNDVSCCVPVQPGGSTTPTNVGQQNADNPALQVADPITPTPNPSDPQMKRMKDLAFRGKRKR